MPTETKDNNMGASIIAGMVLAGLQFLIKEAPGAYAAIQKLVNKPNPTDQDFEDSKAQIVKDSYASIATNSQLPK